MGLWLWRLRVIEAAAWLGLWTVAIRVVPFRRFAGRLAKEPAVPVPTEAVVRGRRVAAAVERATRFSPSRFLCLSRALALRTMLRRRGLPTRLHLSAGPADGGLAAHAWLTAGGVVLIGGGAAPGQVELASFD